MPENSDDNRHYNKPVSNEDNKNVVQFVNNLNNHDETFDNIRDQVRYCIQTVLKEVKEDDKLVTQIFYVMLSAYSNDPCNLAINAPPGEGKTYNLQKVGNLFPQNDITFISHMSEKALFHRNGISVIKDENCDYVSLEDKIKEIDNQIEEKECEIEDATSKDLKKGIRSLTKELERDKKDLQKNAMKLIDLQHKILVFLDTPKPELLSAIMTLLSHDQYEVEYEYTDTHNGIKTKNNILRGWPVVIFAQAIDYSHNPRWPEIQRRFIITNPKMSKEKYEKAIDLIGDKYGLPDFVYQQKIVSDEEKENARKIVVQIKENMLDITDRMTPGKNSVIVPFNDIIIQSLPKDSASDITFTARLFGLIRLIPLIKQDKRPYLQIRKTGDTKLQKYPFALFEDLSESLFLMEYSNGLRPYVLEWYHDIFIALYNSKTKIGPDSKITNKGEELIENRIAVNTEELVTKTLEKYDKTYTKKQILDTYLYPLINSGYIDKIESKIDKRQNIYYPLINSRKNRNLFEIGQSNNYLQKRKLIIENLTSFPSKEYIISKIGEVLKYSENIDGFVKIFDHEGNEMTTVEELVEKYYNNSEDYFMIKDKNERSSDDNDENDDSNDNNIGCQNSEVIELSPSDLATTEISNNNCQNNEKYSSKSEKVSEYSHTGKSSYELEEGSQNDINISNNINFNSNNLFDDLQTNNFSFSDQLSYKCNYCDSEFFTEKEHLKHCVNYHEKKPAQPDREMIQVMKEHDENVELKGNPWE